MFANLLYVAALVLVSPLVLYRSIRHGRYRRGISQKLFGLSRVEAQSLVQNASTESRLGNVRKQFPDFTLPLGGSSEARGGLSINMPKLFPNGSLAGSNCSREKSGCVWIHAVSVGEVNLLPNLVRRLENERTDSRVVISTSTDTGYDLAVKHFGEARVFFCPLDFTWAVSRTLGNLRPELLILTELELWPNLIRLASQSGCRIAVINGRLSERSARRYKKFAWLTRSIFQRLTWVGCQDEACRDRFAACGVEASRMAVTGSMKFDNAVLSRDHVETQGCAEWAGVDPWHRVWVVGSTQPGEELMALAIYKQVQGTFPELRLVIVPRHAERFDAVAQEIRDHGFLAHRRSCDESLDATQWTSDRVILVDTIGELKHWWGVCHMATVGGSFGNRGGQNMLEPAGFGAAVSFGPNTKNFAEIANRLVEARGAVRVQDADELREFVYRCLNDQPSADELGRAARSVVQAHLGATDRTIAHLVQGLAGGQVVDERQRGEAA